MPFKSKSQRRFAYAHPEKFGGKKGLKHWESVTPKGIPEKVGKAELEKGAKGDWQKEGYKIHIEKTKNSTFGSAKNDLQVVASHPHHGEVGWAYIVHDPDTGEWHTHNLGVNKDHQRKGLANAMYSEVEKRVGQPLVMSPYTTRTEDAKALWSQPNRPFGKSELSKGAKGDWQKEGYQISHEIDGDTISVTASKNGKKVGELYAGKSQVFPNKIKSANTTVDKEHRRKGLATAMYQHAEKIMGMKFATGHQSADAKKLWSQPNRPFGKAELPKRHKLGIGKPMGTAHYVHKDYADKVVPKDILSHAQGKLPKDFDYHVVKYDPKEGSVSFIQSHDFDTSDEPSVADSIKVHRDGSTKYRKAPSRTQIYHHKWMFVPDEHKGFDVDQSKKRSLSWLGREDLDSKKIGWKDYWDKKMGKSEPLAKAMKDFYKPEQMAQHKEHLDWAKNTLPNENWKEFFARNHSKSPESFTPEVKSHLEHFSGSTHLPEINKFRFDPKDTFEEGIKKLQGAEGQAQARLANSINIVKPTPETEKVLDNGDGTAWYDLNKPFCEAEGKAMGHCGNKPSAREGDHVLSLRKIHKIGGQEYHEPMLTFIENNGYLGEMKGRANNKPTAKTHKAIANLLMSPRIKQTVGGGYAHFSNFHVDDLSPELKGEVLRSKPNIDPYSSGLGEDAPEHFKKEVESVKKLRDSYKQKHGENWREALVKDLPSLSSDIALGEFPVLNALPNPTDEELLGFVNHPDSLQVFKIHSAMSAKNNAPHHRTLSRISPNSLEYLQNPNVEAILDGDYSDSKAQEAELLGHLSRNPSMSTSRAKKLAQHPRLNDYHIDRMTQNYGDNIEVAKALLDQPSHKFSDFYGGKNRLIRAHANNPENFQAILDHPNVHAYDLMKWFDADETQKKELPKEVLKQVVSHPKNADGALSQSFANSLANRSYVGERHLPLLHTIIDDPKADDAIVTNIAKAHARGVKDAISRKTDQSFRDRELEQKILDHPNASADTIAHIARLPNSDNDLRELIKHPKADAKTIHAAMAQGGKQNFEFLKELIGNKKVSPKTMELLSFSIGNHPEKADEIIDMILKHPKTSATALEALATKLSTYEGKKHRHRFKDILAHKKVGANAMKIINDSIYPRENEDDRETVKRLINHPKATPTVLDAVSDRHSYGTSIPEELKQILRERRQGIKKSEDLEKGSRQARIPFNPLSDFYAPSRNPQLLNIQTWQDEGAPERPSRDAIVKDTGNVRERFLHKLAGKTSVRRAKDGGVEYLLHRGETGARILPNPETADTHVSHEDNTSWTPHFGKAYRFAYNTNTQKPDTLHSAWIHENDILTVPNQYGYIGNPYKGKNKWHTEHEVIVRPHHSEKAKYEHVFEDDVHPDLQERITRRGKGEKWRQSPKRLLSQRRELGKSEPLTKAPMVADAYKDVIRTHTFDPVEHNPEDSHDSEGVNYIGSTNFGGHRIHTFHENYMDGESFIHHVITDNGEHTGKPLSRVSIEQQIPDDYEDYGDETHHLTHAATHPDHRGKGMSYALHKFAIKDLNGKTLHSDIRLSPESHAVWKKLKRDPDLKVKLSRKLRDYDTAHTANWMGKSELAKGSRSKRFPFNPLQDINPNNPVHIHNFQEYDGDSDPDDLWGARNAIQPDHGNIRQRFLLGLHPQTEVRRAKDGKREFLLHRGVDSDAEFDEYSGNKIDKKKVSHAQNSSWTPHIGFAASRMATGQDKDLVSAWIHEDKIVTVPKQYGNLDRRWGEGKGKNDFANEHEVIVAPHTSELHQPTVTKSELAKALTPEEMKAQGYKFKILKPSKRREAYAVTAHHNGKKVGHLVFSKDPRMGSREDNAHEKGFHETYTGHIEPEHRGKGLYQQMLHIGAEHAKSLGGEGLMSSGYQRSGDATRAWDKVASFAQDPKNSTSIKPLPYRANYFLKKSDVKTLRQKRQGHYAKKILEGLKKIRKL